MRVVTWFRLPNVLTSFRCPTDYRRSWHRRCPRRCRLSLHPTAKPQSIPRKRFLNCRSSVKSVCSVLQKKRVSWPFAASMAGRCEIRGALAGERSQQGAANAACLLSDSILVAMCLSSGFVGNRIWLSTFRSPVLHEVPSQHTLASAATGCEYSLPSGLVISFGTQSKPQKASNPLSVARCSSFRCGIVSPKCRDENHGLPSGANWQRAKRTYGLSHDLFGSGQNKKADAAEYPTKVFHRVGLPTNKPLGRGRGAF